jgi:hypothetical protein
MLRLKVIDPFFEAFVRLGYAVEGKRAPLHEYEHFAGQTIEVYAGDRTVVARVRAVRWYASLAKYVEGEGVAAADLPASWGDPDAVTARGGLTAIEIELILVR